MGERGLLLDAGNRDPGPVNPDLAAVGEARRFQDLVLAGATDLLEHSLEVPLEYYRDQDRWSREIEHLRRSPIVVAASGMVADPNSYLVETLLGESLLITRDARGQAHVFANACRHRGAMVAQGCGTARRHICPYHAWTYGAVGSLLAIPGQDGFSDRDPAQLGLIEYPSQEKHGLIFAVLTPGAALDVDAMLGELGPELGQWGYEGQAFRGRKTIDLKANWKSTLEAFSETYHISTVHTRSLQSYLGNVCAYTQFGRHHRMLLALRSVREAVIGAADPLTAHRKHINTSYWICPNLILINDVVGTQYLNILPGPEVGSSIMIYGYITTLDPADPAQGQRLEAVGSRMSTLLENEDAAVLALCGATMARHPAPSLLIGRNEPSLQNIYRALSAIA